MQGFVGSLLPAVALAAAAAVSAAQAAPHAPAPSRPALELAFTYATTSSQPVNGSRFWMQGGAAQIHGQFYGGLGAVADITGTHIANINSSGVGLDLVTATFGPRYTWKPAHARYSIYGQGLIGEAWGMNSVFPNPANANTVANGMAVKTGGGLNLLLGPRLALRVLEADYLRTQLPNGTNNAQNNLQLGAGIVLRLP